METMFGPIPEPATYASMLRVAALPLAKGRPTL